MGQGLCLSGHISDLAYLEVFQDVLSALLKTIYNFEKYHDILADYKTCSCHSKLRLSARNLQINQFDIRPRFGNFS